MTKSPKKTKNKEKAKSRRLWTLNEKLEIIDMRDNGASWTKIAQEKNMAESTVRSIYAKKDEIRSHGK